MYFLTAVSLFSLAFAAPIPQGTTQSISDQQSPGQQSSTQQLPVQQSSAQQPGAIVAQPGGAAAPLQPEVITQTAVPSTQGVPTTQPSVPIPQTPTESPPPAVSAPPVGQTAPAKPAQEEIDKWTIVGYTRTCDTTNTICTVRFQVDERDGGFDPATAPFCRISLAGSGGSVSLQPQPADGCPDYSIGSQWDPKGFTVLSVVNKE